MVLPSKPKRELVNVLGSDWVKDDAVTCYTYRCDGLTLHPVEPIAVVYPNSAKLVSMVLKILAKYGLTFLARGAGTGLSGGAIPQANSVIIEMARFNQIYELDLINRTATVGAAVVNQAISDVVKPHGLFFAPDPSSQKACTIGGNVGENAGGPHTLKYGVTVNHILGLELVLPNGEIVNIGGKTWGSPGPDVLALMVGSEGTFAITTQVTCRLTPLPEKTLTMLAVFSSMKDACRAVSNIIRAGIVPAALEMIDRVVIRAVEPTVRAGLPLDAEAVLIIELEDLADGLEEEAKRIRTLCEKNHVREMRRAANEKERGQIWRARKEAIGAIGAISPSFYIQDGVIPRGKLPEILAQILAIGEKYGLVIANVFHAGDGNLHPLILYNCKNPEEVQKTLAAGEDILRLCVEAGGTLSGEHGIGLEKAHLMDCIYTEADLENMQQVRQVFNPDNRLNPGKIFPTPARCAELKRFVKRVC